MASLLSREECIDKITKNPLEITHSNVEIDVAAHTLCLDKATFDITANSSNTDFEISVIDSSGSHDFKRKEYTSITSFPGETCVFIHKFDFGPHHLVLNMIVVDEKVHAKSICFAFTITHRSHGKLAKKAHRGTSGGGRD